MKQIDRSILGQFARDVARCAGSFAAIGVLVLCGRVFGRYDAWPPAIVIEDTISRALRVVELAIQLGAPLAVVLTLSRLARQGSLLGVFAAGYAARDLARVLGLAAGGTVVLVLVVHLAGLDWDRSRSEVSGTTLWTNNGVHTFCLDYDAKARRGHDVFVFRDDDLSVLHVDELVSRPDGSWTARRATRLVGDPTAPEAIPNPDRADPRHARQPSGAWPWAMVCNRLCVGGALVLLLGYVALSIPSVLLSAGLAAFLAISLAAGYALVWIQILSWRGAVLGLVLHFACWGSWAGMLVVLHRRFANRGLRLR